MLFLIILITIVVFYLVLAYRQTPKDLTNKVILVTGGANGLGKELSLQLARLGCKIAIADFDMKNAEKTVQEITRRGNEAAAYKVDVSNLEDIQKLKLYIERDLGTVDIVINNAAILYTKSIEDEDPKLLEKIMDVNVMSLFWTTRVFLGEMKRRKSGHIISISSAAGLVGGPDLQAYSTSKFAVRGFMDSLYVNLHREGYGNVIHTSTVYPWFINTRGYIQEFTENVFKNCLVFDTEDVAKDIIDGFRRNKRVIAIPSFFYLFGYVINTAVVANNVFKLMTNKPKKNVIFKDDPARYREKQFLISN
uniref:Short-chain dehydrogenase/reductase 3 n=1 Tax=Culicoides sonorensis TaxID=179676 RepID=A0A336LUK6_CULSO